ncbi:MAG: Fe-S-cluster containining protein [Planctomycetota bacterium]|jgi:Fe-S-cluster containining protein
MSVDPRGAQALVPFEFDCHRCGNCCTGGEGRVWLEDGELEAMAGRLDMTPENFSERYVRTVPDPNTGRLRLSLREQEEGAGGRCSLLDGANHCTVYSDRPEHCRSFPYWPTILTEERAFEVARAVCPGISVLVDEQTKQTAFERLRVLYEEVDAFVTKSRAVCIARGLCCRFEEAGHELFSTGLEADYAAHVHPEAPAPEADERCPYHVAGRCTAREGRPLGCRTYFCDVNTQSVLEDAHEFFLRGIRQIERDTGYPASYARFPALLERRGVGSGKKAPPGASGPA